MWGGTLVLSPDLMGGLPLPLCRLEAGLTPFANNHYVKSLDSKGV